MKKTRQQTEKYEWMDTKNKLWTRESHMEEAINFYSMFCIILCLYYALMYIYIFMLMVINIKRSSVFQFVDDLPQCLLLKRTLWNSDKP